jgi:hypothetical protein
VRKEKESWMIRWARGQRDTSNLYKILAEEFCLWDITPCSLLKFSQRFGWLIVFLSNNLIALVFQFSTNFNGRQHVFIVLAKISWQRWSLFLMRAKWPKHLKVLFYLLLLTGLTANWCSVVSPPLCALERNFEIFVSFTFRSNLYI